MNPYTDFSQYRSRTLIALMTFCAVILLMGTPALAETTAAYLEAVEKHGWSWDAVLVGLYVLIFLGGAYILGLVVSAGSRVLRERLLGV